MSRKSADWTTVGDIRRALSRRWARGDYLTAHARADTFAPIDLPIHGPRPPDLGERYSEVEHWISTWRTATGVGHFTVSEKTVGTRSIAARVIPSRFMIDSHADLVSFLGHGDRQRKHDAMIEQAVVPELREWAIARPVRALDHHDQWTRLQACVEWIRDHPSGGRYLRHVDPHGVDTKFIEQHRFVLAELLDLVLPDDRVDPLHSPSAFARRYGFDVKPSYVRMRSLDPNSAILPLGLSEITARTDELDQLRLSLDRVFVIENEISYLAFPPVPRSLAIFGGGYALTATAGISWLAHVPIRYWGDIDTHGFAILDQMRARFPDTASIMMDRDTLLAHESAWTTEDSKVNTRLTHLTDSETEVYHNLIEDTYGASVRLEQERIRFQRVREAVAVID